MAARSESPPLPPRRAAVQYRPGSCSWLPEQLPAELVTHVNFAFAKMAPGARPPFSWRMRRQRQLAWNCSKRQEMRWRGSWQRMTPPPPAPPAAGHQLNTTEWNDAALYQQTQLLKTRNPNLKTLIAVGGWDHNNPNATTAHLFSKAVATTAARKKFIASILAFTAKYGFDGCALRPLLPGGGQQPGL